MDLSQFQSLGWGTAVAVLAIAAMAALFRHWKKADAAGEELKNAEEAYKLAVGSGDPDRIHIAGKRLQDARRKAGGA
jgi:hypothetical protein